MGIDWKRKLSSRKFWMAVVGWLTGLLILFKVPESEAAQIGAIVMQTGAILSYIFSEGWIDSANAGFDYSEGESGDE